MQDGKGSRQNDGNTESGCEELFKHVPSPFLLFAPKRRQVFLQPYLRNGVIGKAQWYTYFHRIACRRSI
jgi:hypothetical protein